MNQYGRAIWLKAFLLWEMALAMPWPLWWIWCRFFAFMIARLLPHDSIREEGMRTGAP